MENKYTKLDEKKAGHLIANLFEGFEEKQILVGSHTKEMTLKLDSSNVFYDGNLTMLGVIGDMSFPVKTEGVIFNFKNESLEVKIGDKIMLHYFMQFWGKSDRAMAVVRVVTSQGVQKEILIDPDAKNMTAIVSDVVKQIGNNQKIK